MIVTQLFSRWDFFEVWGVMLEAIIFGSGGCEPILPVWKKSGDKFEINTPKIPVRQNPRSGACMVTHERAHTLYRLMFGVF